VGQEPKQKEAGRLSQLRKYIPTSEDAEIVKGMIADGLSNDDILHALGHVSGAPNMGVLPNGHEHSNKMTTEQEEREAQAAELQPGQAVGDVEGEGEDDGSEDNMLSHVAGLLTHVAKGKAKNGVKSSSAGRNRR